MNTSVPIQIARSLSTFKQLLDLLCTSHPYSTCYMSLGSKHNEDTTHFSYPENIRDKSIKSNAEHQMFPGYLRTYFPEKRGLIVVIDHFPSETSETNNIRLLNNISRLSNKNMDILIFNTLVTTESIKEITRSVLAMLDTLQPSSYLFANFICFRNTPNDREMQLEQNIPKTIQTILTQESDGKYKNCLYQWYGYTYYQYHYIYCYNTYHLFRMMRATQLLRLLKDKLDTIQISPHDIHIMNIEMEIDQSRNSRHIWREFCSNSKTIL